MVATCHQMTETLYTFSLSLCVPPSPPFSHIPYPISVTLRECRHVQDDCASHRADTRLASPPNADFQLLSPLLLQSQPHTRTHRRPTQPRYNWNQNHSFSWRLLNMIYTVHHPTDHYSFLLAKRKKKIERNSIAASRHILL